MPKTGRSGQAAILTSDQLDALMEQLHQPLGRAVFQTARFTAGRISEVLSLRWGNVFCSDFLVIPKCVTKKKVRTREIPLNPRLQEELALWRRIWVEKFNKEPHAGDWVFPAPACGADPSKHAMRRCVDRMLRQACSQLGVADVSTHSFWRSALTAASDAGLPLRHIQEISGHSSLAVLQAYLQCSDQQKRAVAMAFG